MVISKCEVHEAKHRGSFQGLHLTKNNFIIIGQEITSVRFGNVLIEYGECSHLVVHNVGNVPVKPRRTHSPVARIAVRLSFDLNFLQKGIRDTESQI